jgi:hypothetical protein
VCITNIMPPIIYQVVKIIIADVLLVRFHAPPLKLKSPTQPLSDEEKGLWRFAQTAVPG